jgi:predicted secreted protein
MGIVTGILVYVILWWMVFFMVLPWGIQPNEQPEVGHQPGAPYKPKLWMRALVTTAAASFAFLILYLFVPADMMQWALFKER